jgi:hypothetical protein
VAGGAPAGLAGPPLVFGDGLLDSREGPWEVTLPEAQAPESEATPLRGAANSSLVENQYSIA